MTNRILEDQESIKSEAIISLVVIAKNGKRLGRLNCPKGVAIDLDTNNIYVTEGTYSLPRFPRVSIFLESGIYVSSFTDRHMKHPWGIAIHKSNIYITDIEEHCIFHFKLEADIPLVNRLGSRGSGIGRFIEPHQLTVSADGDIFITDCSNHRLQILDRDLNYQRHIAHHSMKLPCDVKLTQVEVYILSKTDSPCIHVFSHSGEKIRSLITSGDGMQIGYALFFCLDAHSNLIISDWRAHQIKFFSKDGRLLHVLGGQGIKAGMFQFPQGLALTNTFKLGVVSLSSNSLQLFSD